MIKQQYYYTVASLPSLSFDKPLPINKEKFFALCKIELVKKDFNILQSAELIPLKPKEKSPVKLMEKWYSWEQGIRNELVRLRSKSLGWDGTPYIRNGKTKIPYNTSIAPKAFNIKSPLSAEEALDRARWNFLEVLEINYYFTIEKLIVYYFKIQILEKTSLFNNKKGLEKIDSLVRKFSENEINTHEN